MRLRYTLPCLFLAFAAVGGAQIVLDPSPARLLGHPAASPAEQLFVSNVNPNLNTNIGMYSPASVAVDTSGATPILYVADWGNNRVLAWKNATSLVNLQTPDLIIGQPNANSTLPNTDGGLYSPTAVLVDPNGNLYVADSGNNRVFKLPTGWSRSVPPAQDSLA